MELSIIIPCYNCRKMVEDLPLYSIYTMNKKAIESHRCEVILVDDCSTNGDTYTDLEDKYPNLRVIKTPKNGCDAIARKTGIKAAKGEWLLFIDSDDCFADNGLNLFFSFTQRDKYNMVCFDVGTVVYNYTYSRYETVGMVDSLLMIATHGRFIRRSILDEDPYGNYFHHPRFRINGDCYFCLALQIYLSKYHPNTQIKLSGELYHMFIRQGGTVRSSGWELYHFTARSIMFTEILKNFGMYIPDYSIPRLLCYWLTHYLLDAFNTENNVMDPNHIYTLNGFNIWFDTVYEKLGYMSWGEIYSFIKNTSHVYVDYNVVYAYYKLWFKHKFTLRLSNLDCSENSTIFNKEDM